MTLSQHWTLLLPAFKKSVIPDSFGLSINDTISRISNVLTQVRLLKDKYEGLAAVTGEDYNVFSILGVETLFLVVVEFNQ